MRAFPNLGLLLLAGALLYLMIGVVLALLTLHIAERDLSVPENRQATGEEAVAILFLTIGWPVALYWAMQQVYAGLQRQRAARAALATRPAEEMAVIADALEAAPRRDAQPARLRGDQHGGLS